MNCYVCGTPRPEGANYCPGCGRYCADDPNARKAPVIPAEDITIEEPIPDETPVPLTEPIPMDETVSEPVVVTEQTEQMEQPSFSDERIEPVSETSIPAEMPRKPKKHRPVLIPVLIMAGLFLVGSIVWFAMPFDRSPEGSPTETTAPSLEKPKHPAGKNDSTSRDPLDSYPPTDERCFRIRDGLVSFIPERYDGSSILVIPSEIDGQTVTGIAPEGFRAMKDVTTLVLPDTLETIGDSAFANCEKLRGVYIPDSVTSIGSAAFSGCIVMESVSIPVETTVIGADAFDGCASLMYIFYDGTYEQWTTLYNEYITPFTFVSCSDGDYYHGVYNP